MTWMSCLLPAVALLAASAAFGPAAAQNVLAGPARVLDGDTVEIQGERIRLHGIDAPESKQTCLDAAGRSYRCGRVAGTALASRLGRGSVSCRILDRGRYGRLIAVCFKDGADVNAWMVSEGHALAYYGNDYVAHERTARARRIGVWQGRFVSPWDWRKGVR